MVAAAVLILGAGSTGAAAAVGAVPAPAAPAAAESADYASDVDDTAGADDRTDAEGRIALRVQAGYDGFARIGRPFLLRIEVAAEGLFAGSLQIAGDPSSLVVTKPVEIPGGATREFTVVWEPHPYGSVETVEVRLTAGGEVVATDTASIVDEPNTELVGVFPDLAERGIPRKAPLLFDSGEALIFPVDPGVLSVGWAALEPLDIAVVTAADLLDLDSAGVDALMAWVNRGGRLLVDEPAGSEIPGVPGAWQPDRTQPRAAGQGEIVLTGGKGASGEWHAMFAPTPTGALIQEGAGVLFNQPSHWHGASLSSSLAEDADISLPSTGWMLLVVGAYIAIMGPGVWLVLKVLRRPELGWAAVPLVAVVFTAGIWAFGVSFRNKTKAAHGTVIEVAPRGTTATVYSLLHSSGGGRDYIPLHPGWSVVPVWSEDTRYPFNIADDASGSTASVVLDTAGFAVIGSRGGSPEFDDAVRVTARSTDSGQISGAVANNLHVDLHDAVVFTTRGGMRIGTVPAGTTVEFDYTTILDWDTAAVLPQVNDFSAAERQFDGLFSSSKIDLLEAGPPLHLLHYEIARSGILGELNFGWSLNGRPGGQIGVVAWSDELAAPLDPGVADGRTLFIARNAIEADGRSVDDLTVHRTLVRGPGDFDLDIPDDFGLDFGFVFASELEGLMLQFLLPEDADIGDLVLVVPPEVLGVEMWNGDDWRWIDLDADTGLLPELSAEVFPSEVFPSEVFPSEVFPFGSVESRVFRLPLESIVNGRVHVRMLLNPRDHAFDAAWRGLVIRSLRDSDELSELSYLAGEAAAVESIAGLRPDLNADPFEWDWAFQNGEDSFSDWPR